MGRIYGRSQVIGPKDLPQKPIVSEQPKDTAMQTLATLAAGGQTVNKVVSGIKQARIADLSKRRLMGDTLHPELTFEYETAPIEYYPVGHKDAGGVKLGAKTVPQPLLVPTESSGYFKDIGREGVGFEDDNLLTLNQEFDGTYKELDDKLEKVPEENLSLQEKESLLTGYQEKLAIEESRHPVRPDIEVESPDTLYNEPIEAEYRQPQVTMPTEKEMDMYLNPDEYTSKDLIDLQEEQQVKAYTEGPREHLSQRPTVSEDKVIPDNLLPGKGKFGSKFGTGEGVIGQIGQGGERWGGKLGTGKGTISKFGGKFGTGQGAIAGKVKQIGATVKGIGTGFKNLTMIGKGGLKNIGQQIGSSLAAKYGTTAAATTAATAATTGVATTAATTAAATGATTAATAAAASGPLAAIGPAGWALMGLSIIGSKLFKPHTALGKIFSIFSDERLKKNIKYVGKSPSGIPIVDFEYRDEMNIPGRYRGVLSKDVPHAKEIHPAYGFDMVDYSELDVEFKRIG